MDCPADHTDVTVATKAVLGSITSAGFDVVLVQRVQNRPLYNRYMLERSAMIAERGAAHLNEWPLFHGSGKLKPQVLAGDRDGFMVELRLMLFMLKAATLQTRPGMLGITVTGAMAVRQELVRY